MKKVINKNINELIQALLSLENRREMSAFLRDLMTENEMKEFANRWLAARLLDQKITYIEIEKRTGLSSRTIARVADWLGKSRNGYRLAINRSNSHHTDSSPSV